MLLGVDVGGTFTDAVLAAEGRLVSAKAPTTPRDQSAGVMAAIEAVLERAGAAAGAVERFAHGMTVATNAVLEGRGARTALVATAGFTDVVELGRQARVDLYRLCAAHPPPLVPAERRVPAPERMGPDGVLRALEDDGIRAVCDAVAACEPEAVAVVLLHAYRHPEHERALGEALRERLPGVHVALSHETVGTFREYERAATTEIDAALSPLLSGYLRALAGRAAESGLPEPEIMQSNGGLADLEVAAGHGVLTVLSGPAGGAAGAAWVSAAAGEPDALCFDMGGTSCDVCVIEAGRARETTERTVGGRTVALPMLDVHTVGAGGGSVAWRDPGGALRVGPRSAGADPGPACYGRGGSEPTVTDANLVLGRLPAGGSLPGGITLDSAAAERAVDGLAGALGLDRAGCAEGIARVADAEMARALRVMTVERGVDPRGFVLLCFGGAGPMHAVAVAEELGMDRVLCPPASGVLAALGMIVSERRRDAQRSVLRAGGDLTAAAVAADVEALGAQARGQLGVDGTELRCRYELRYRGQAFELPVDGGEAPLDPGELREAFAAAHAERYGHADPDGEVELVTVRVSAVVPAPDVSSEVERDREAGGEPAGSRAVRFAGAEHDTAIWTGPPGPGARIAGPAVCELGEATLVVPPGWAGEADAAGAIHLARGSGA